MSVGARLHELGLGELKIADDGSGAKVEVLLDDLDQSLLIHTLFARAVGLDVERRGSATPIA